MMKATKIIKNYSKLHFNVCIRVSYGYINKAG